jgi:3-hydroxyisobutyrate dehydrogenase-like beta-hydroxyacid dehydrogenase
MADVAFVGIGTMGLPMAAQLVRAGHDVVACDADPGRAATAGGRVAPTPAEAAQGAEVAIMSLPSPAAVEQVALSPGGLIEGLTAGSVAVDMSTSPPRLARRLAGAFGERGVEFLDAPVSGGPVAARAATLAILAGERKSGVKGKRAVISGTAGAGRTNQKRTTQRANGRTSTGHGGD